MARVAYGFVLPAAVLGALWRDPVVRRRWLRISLAQSAVTVAVAVAALGAGGFSGPRVEDGAGWWRRGLLLWAGIYTAVHLLQTAVIGLSRDFHTEVSREASLRVGLSPEDPPLRPRIRVNWKWIRRRLARRVRTAMLFAMVTPLIYPLLGFLPGGSRLFPVVMAGWGFYWWMVFAAAKSARAWEDESTAGPPWFVRVAGRAISTVPPLRWLGLAWLARLWTRFSRPLWAPASCVEHSPWVFSGLALAKAVGSLPLLKLWLRPFFSVSAALLLVERGASADVPALPGDVGEVGAELAAEERAGARLETPAVPGLEEHAPPRSR